MPINDSLTARLVVSDIIIIAGLREASGVVYLPSSFIGSLRYSKKAIARHLRPAKRASNKAKVKMMPRAEIKLSYAILMTKS